jgi:hypothetical protein
VFFYRSFNINKSGAGIIFLSPEEKVFKYMIHFEFPTINYILKYEAFLAGVSLTEALNAYLLQVHNNS